MLFRSDEVAGKLDGLLARGMERRQHLLADRQKRLQIASPEAKVAMAQDRTKVYHARMEKSMQALLERSRLKLGSRVSKLSAMNPLSVLERGYGVVERDGRILSSAKSMAVGDVVTLRVSDGKAQAEIRSIEMKNNEN